MSLLDRLKGAAKKTHTLLQKPEAQYFVGLGSGMQPAEAMQYRDQMADAQRARARRQVFQQALQEAGGDPQKMMQALAANPDTVQHAVSMYKHLNPAMTGEGAFFKWIHSAPTEEERALRMKQYEEFKAMARGGYFTSEWTEEGPWSFNTRTNEWTPPDEARVVGGRTVKDLRRTADDPEVRGAVAGEEEAAKKWAQTDAEFMNMTRTDVPQMRLTMTRTNELLNKFRDRKIRTGMVEGRISQFTDPETAALQYQAVAQVLQNLKRTNLAPVTVEEINLLMNLYASIEKDEAVNIAVLEEANRTMQRHWDAIVDAMRHMRRAGTLRTYISPWLLEDLPAGGTQRPPPGDSAPPPAQGAGGGIDLQSAIQDAEAYLRQRQGGAQ